MHFSGYTFVVLVSISGSKMVDVGFTQCATVWLNDVFLKVFVQHWSSMAQKNIDFRYTDNTC